LIGKIRRASARGNAGAFFSCRSGFSRELFLQNRDIQGDLREKARG